MKKKAFLFILSAIFLLILGGSLAITILSLEGFCTFDKTTPQVWVLITTCSFFSLFLVQLYSLKLSKEKHTEETLKDRHNLDAIQLQSSNLRDDFERFKRNSLHALKAHLKLSALFWIHFYKKEQIKTIEEAKKEVFRDLKKEFLPIPWGEEMIDEIKQELSHYNGKEENKKKPPS